MPNVPLLKSGVAWLWCSDNRSVGPLHKHRSSPPITLIDKASLHAAFITRVNSSLLAGQLHTCELENRPWALAAHFQDCRCSTCTCSPFRVRLAAVSDKLRLGQRIGVTYPGDSLEARTHLHRVSPILLRSLPSFALSRFRS
jgi:hypothetical protein